MLQSEQKQVVIVTNNSAVYNEQSSRFEVQYFSDQSYVSILKTARDYLHKSFKLVSHPMAGSLKPNQTPYKSVVVRRSDGIDFDSIALIENSIATAEKFLQNKSLPVWSERIKEDFKRVDASLIESCFL